MAVTPSTPHCCIQRGFISSFDEEVFLTALYSQGLWRTCSVLSPHLTKPSTNACTAALQAQSPQPRRFLSLEQDLAGNRSENSKATLSSPVLHPWRGWLVLPPSAPGGTDAARLAPVLPGAEPRGLGESPAGRKAPCWRAPSLPGGQLPCACPL